jgi:hypothetical protein
VIEIPSSDNKVKKLKKKKKKDVPAGTVMTKAYKHAEPFDNVKRPHSAAATMALNKITSVFDLATL